MKFCKVVPVRGHPFSPILEETAAIASAYGKCTHIHTVHASGAKYAQNATLLPVSLAIE